MTSPLLSIFAIPKPFSGHIGTIQMNAVKSWTLLDGPPQVLLMGDDNGVGEASEMLGAAHYPDLARNEFGTPLLSDAFVKANRLASGRILAYVNSDIILGPGLMEAVTRCARRFEKFMMVGRRTDLDIRSPIDFHDPAWSHRLFEKAQKKGKLRPSTAIDYFIFPKKMWPAIPPFAVGRITWDNWFIFATLKRRIPVIDVSGAVLVIHQNHDYSHLPCNKDGNAFRKGPEAMQNTAISKDRFIWVRGNIDTADWELSPAGFLQRPKEEITYRVEKEILIREIREAAEKGDWDGAFRKLNHFKKLYDKDPSGPRQAAELELGLLHQSGRLSNLDSISEKTIENYLKIGGLLLQAGDIQSAFNLVTKSLDFDPGNLGAVYLYALCLDKMDQVDMAARLLKKYIDMGLFTREIIELYGKIARKAGKTAIAAKAYEKYLTRHPQDRDIRALLDRVNGADASSDPEKRD